MDKHREYQYSPQDGGEKTSSSTPTSEEPAFNHPLHSEPMEPLSFSAFTHFPTGFSCMYDNELEKALRSNPGQPCAELSVYDTRTQRFLTKQERIFVKSEVSFTEQIIQEVSKTFHVDKTNVVYHHLEAWNEESSNNHFVVILPLARSSDTLVLVLQCHYFDQHIDDEYFCLRIDKTQTVSEIKELIKRELRWKGLELFINETHMGDESELQEFDLQDFSLMVATKSVSKTVTFLYKPTADIKSHFRISINASDSVKTVKQKLLNRFEPLLTLETKGSKCLHITCASELLEDQRCFGMTNKFHRENMYQIHFAPPNVIVCILNYQSGKERLRNLEKATILVSPNCSSAELREEAAKHMHIDPKAVKLDTDTKQRIEEMPDVSMTNALYSRCTINAGVKKKKTLLVKDPVSQKPEKVASLYALEPVSTLRKMIAKKYGIKELQIVIKHKGITLKDKKLLYNYPIKNNVVLDLHIFERRTHVIANVSFKKSKVALIIDDCEKTTIGDILKYCAIQLNYRSNCSRCVYAGQCLDKNTTVKAADIGIGSEVIILHFDEGEQLQGRLQRIFMVDMDGRVVSRYGSVAGGLLLRAPKNVTLKPTNEDEKENLPEGIHKTAILRKTRITGSPAKATDETKKRTDIETLKNRFLRKARHLIERKYVVKRTTSEFSCLQNATDADQTYVKRIEPNFIAPKEEDEIKRLERGTTSQSDMQKLAGFTDQTKEKTTSAGFLTEESKIGSTRPEFYLGGEKESSIPATERFSPRFLSLDEIEIDGNTGGTCCNTGAPPHKYHGDIASQTDNFNRSDKPNKEEIARKANGQGEFMRSNTEPRQCQAMENSNLCPSDEGACNALDIPAKVLNERLSRNAIHENVLKALFEDSGASSDSGYRADMEENSDWHILRQIMQSVDRRRTGSEQQEVSNMALAKRLTLERYLPTNRLLTTSGITVLLLNHISSEIGTHWKRLARNLDIDETEMDELEHKRCSLYETSFQCLLLWKRKGGLNASKECLIKALRDIKMTSLAEACENFAGSGYQTT